MLIKSLAFSFHRWPCRRHGRLWWRFTVWGLE